VLNRRDRRERPASLYLLIERMVQMSKNSNVMTPEFRVSFPNVFRPAKPMQDGAEPKYSITMLFKPGENLDALKKAAMAAVVEKWGTDKSKYPKNLRTPFRDQGEKSYDGYIEGAIFITATSKQRPGLIDSANVDILDEAAFYAGCYARATLRPFVYSKAGNNGVAFGLQNLQKLRDGESLTGRMRAQDEFAPVSDEEIGEAAATGSGAAGLFD
jgi:Enterobacter phage Enc34, ssDNA-binding protein